LNFESAPKRQFNEKPDTERSRSVLIIRFLHPSTPLRIQLIGLFGVDSILNFIFFKGPVNQKIMKKAVLFFSLGVFFLISLCAISQTTQEQLQQIRSKVVEVFDGKEYYIHTVKRGQTLYRISKAYNVDVNELIKENPQVKEGLKADQKLRIPTAGLKPAVTEPKPVIKKEKPVAANEKTVPATDTLPKPDSIIQVELLPCGKDTTTKKVVYQVALMLPLYLDEVDQLKSEDPGPDIFETSKSLQFLPFYEGFRLALDSLEKTGLRIKLYVYDVDKDTARTRQLLKKPELKSMDLIFGLLYHRNFQMVAAFAEKNKINIVNPVSERSDIVSGNPYVFKIRPSKRTQAEQLAAFMAQSYYRGQVLIVRNGQYADKDAPERLKKECQDLNMNVQIVEGQDAAIGRLSKEKENFLICFSENPAYTIDLTRRMYELRDEYSLVVVGLPDWAAMEGLETEYLVTLKTHVMSANLIDYDNLYVKKFVRQYQNTYKSDPSLLAFQGFDMSFYFLSALKNFGTNIQRCLGEVKMNLLQNNFDFSQKKGNGFENQHWSIYKYENYRLVKAN